MERRLEFDLEPRETGREVPSCLYVIAYVETVRDTVSAYGPFGMLKSYPRDSERINELQVWDTARDITGGIRKHFPDIYQQAEAEALARAADLPDW